MSKLTAHCSKLTQAFTTAAKRAWTDHPYLVSHLVLDPMAIAAVTGLVALSSPLTLPLAFAAAASGLFAVHSYDIITGADKVAKALAHPKAFARRNDVRDLMTAAKAGDVKKLDKLKKRHVNLEAEDDNLENALMKAAANNKTNFVQALVDAKVNLRGMDILGLTALDLAELYKNQGSIDALKAAGAPRSPMYRRR